VGHDWGRVMLWGELKGEKLHDKDAGCSGGETRGREGVQGAV